MVSNLFSKNKIKAALLFFCIYAISLTYYLKIELATPFLFELKSELNTLGKVDNLLVGSSITQSVLPQALSPNSYTVFSGGADLVDYYRILNETINTVRIEGNVIILLDHEIFQRTRKKEFFETLHAEYLLGIELPKSSLLSGFLEPLIQEKKFINYSLKRVMGLDKTFLNGREIFPSAHGPGWESISAYTDEDRAVKNLTPSGNTFRLPATDRTDYRIRWEKLLDLGTQQNLSIFLVTPPFHPVITDNDKAVVDYEHFDQMIALAHDRGIDYLDFSRYFDDLKYTRLFFDARHLNDEGAMQFTGVLANALEIRQVAANP